MAEATETLLRRNLTEVFGQRDATKRRRVIDELMTTDFVFCDHTGRHVGRDALDTAVTALQARFPDFVFTELGPAQAIAGAGRLHWGFGPPGQPPRVTGLDVIVVRDGLIAELYTFLDPPTAR
jgi:hypothetical protein